MLASANVRPLLIWCALAGCHETGTGPSGGPARLRTAWHVQTPGATGAFWLGRPAVDGGRVFIQSANLALGIDANTGAVLWQRPVRVAPSPPPTTLLARDGRVYISEVDSVMALEAETGRTTWAFHPDSQAVVEPALDATTLYTGQRGIPVVYALDRVDGTLRWRTNLGVGYQYLAYVRGVAVSGDTVYATLTRDLSRGSAPASGVLVALDRRDGHELWRYEASPSVGSGVAPGPLENHGFINAPVITGRLVVVTDFLGLAVTAVDPATQQVAWSYHLRTNGPKRVVLRDNVLYVAGADGSATALDAAGLVRWRREGFGSAAGGETCASAFYLNDDRLQGLDISTGQLTGRAETGSYDRVFTSELATDGTRVYLTGGDGVYAITCQ